MAQPQWGHLFKLELQWHHLQIYPKKLVKFAFGHSLYTFETFFPDFSLFGGAESLSEGKQPSAWLPRRTEIPRPQNLQDIYGQRPRDPSDFLWLMTEEPHRSRRMAIMKAHPEVSHNSLVHPFLSGLAEIRNLDVEL